VPDVILPALNEAAAVGWVLQRMPSGFHPIVVDNGSTDATAAIAAAHGAIALRNLSHDREHQAKS